MSQQILQVDQAMLETTLDRMVRKSVEETLNAMLDAEADEITGAARGRQLPGRAQRVDAHLRESPLRNFQRVVDATLPRHVKTR